MRVADFRWMLLLAPVAAAALLPTGPVAGRAQTGPELQTFFRENVGLTAKQISSIQEGRPVVKVMQYRTPEEVFLFGAVLIHAAPESMVKLSRDLDYIRESPEFLSIEEFHDPPQLSDLRNFGLDPDEIQDLKNCKPGNCDIQIPAESMAALRKSIDWSAPNVNWQVNQVVRKSVLDRLLAYRNGDDSILGTYNDKPVPTDVSKEFADLLSFSKALPQYLPEFYRYLLDYPKGKPANVESRFYWSKVKFGLKPTLRVVQVLTFSGGESDEIAYAIAEKQIYSSHYFKAALDLKFCVRSEDKTHPGFYLIMAMGSSQEGLTGWTGWIVRKAGVSRSLASLREELAKTKDKLEKNQR
jgi:hypothetical protein